MTILITGVAHRLNEKNRPKENTGNLIHAVSARLILKNYNDKDNMRINIPLDKDKIDYIRGRFSKIVLITANMIRLSKKHELASQHKIVADNIKKIGLPVVAFSIGSQAQNDYELDNVLAPETEYLLKTIGDHSKSIGVRGSKTGYILSKNGINNYKVIGCQSCFMNLKDTFDFDIKKISGHDILINMTGYRKDKQIIEIAIRNKFTMIGQQEYFEESLSRRENITLNRFYDNLTKNGIDKTDILNYFYHYFKKFYSFEEWINFIKNKSFCVGTRFHGNMMAFQNGVPSLWVMHDTRTEELCDYLCLPSISLNEIKNNWTIENFIEKYDPSIFLKNYQQRFYRFKEFLDENGLENKLISSGISCNNKKTRSFARFLHCFRKHGSSS